MGSLDTKVAIITGAARGLGFGEALEIVRQGGAVVVNDVDDEAGHQAAADLGTAGGQAVFVAGDVSEPGVAAGLVAVAVETFGQLDALVNNAGTLRDRTMVKMSIEDWDLVLKVHLRGHFLATQAAANYWKSSQRPGHLVHTTSTAGLLGNFGQINYGAAKAGIAAFSTIVAYELSRHGINSNAIAPAARTRMTSGAFGAAVDAKIGDFDFWDPRNVAPLVAYLCSDAAAHITGKVFGVQGDAVELYRPWTSVGAIENERRRWEPEQLAARMDGLLAGAGIEPGIDDPQLGLRYPIAETR
jgi:NAD(P)-dependent dehydrogenase (short-subunit alcohol dehydrogenase family)